MAQGIPTSNELKKKGRTAEAVQKGLKANPAFHAALGCARTGPRPKVLKVFNPANYCRFYGFVT